MSSTGNETAARRQVTILGAGPAGLAAAFALSRTAELRQGFAVTIYQMGWRAGGKCATGRAIDRGWRIEQNGSHYLFGCYLNSFAMLAEAYQELAAHGEKGFGSYREQLVPRGLVVARAEPSEGSAPPAMGCGGGPAFARRAAREDQAKAGDNWFTFLPETAAAPEKGGKYPPPSHVVFVVGQLALAALLGLFVNSDARPARATRWVQALFPISPFHRGGWPRLARTMALAAAWLIDVPIWMLLRLVGAILVALAAVIPRRTRGRLEGLGVATLRALTRGARALARAVDRPLAARSTGWRGRLHRLCVLSELGATAAIGIIDDQLWKPGRLEGIDGEDFRQWLRRHAGPSVGLTSVAECPLIKIWYDAVVAYEDGDCGRPSISAAVTLHALFRAVVTYKGAFAYQMTHEVGDSFIGPIVRALQLRGVEIRFFHRVRGFEARTYGEASFIHKIVLEEQLPAERREKHLVFAEMKAGGAGATAPPRKVWPNHPLFSDGATCPEPAAPLDAHQAADSGLRTVLELGTHFDEVIFTLPPGVARGLTPLMKQPAWQAMVEGVKSVATQSLRLWFKPDLAGLGWPHGNPILSGFSPPYSTWEDNSQNLNADQCATVAPGESAGSIATMFGPLSGRIQGRELSLAEQKELARKEAWAFFRDQARLLWTGLPESVQDRYAVLLAPPGTIGEGRFAWQLQRANTGPMESYVLALPGTLGCRLRPDESGFANMYLAGEWTRNGFEVGCVEGAVLSGLLAARAVSGDTWKVVGEDDLGFGPFRRGPRPRKDRAPAAINGLL
jgi:uncharacterized protein with NAD-binding domain and iron-sulfur cluster